MSSKFFIGADKYAGVFKLQEECAELSVVLAKLVTVDGGDYFDGRFLDKELMEEVADVYAAILYYIGHTSVEKRNIINERTDAKLKLFEEWHDDENKVN